MTFPLTKDAQNQPQTLSKKVLEAVLTVIGRAEKVLHLTAAAKLQVIPFKKNMVGQLMQQQLLLKTR